MNVIYPRNLFHRAYCDFQFVFSELWCLLPNIGRNVLMYWGRGKMTPILADDIFKCNFVNKNVFNFDWNCTEFCSQGSNWQWEIGTGNGLASKRRQAITWTNDDPVEWHIWVNRSQWVILYASVRDIFVVSLNTSNIHASVTLSVL